MSSVLRSAGTGDIPQIVSPFSIRAMFWKARHLDGSPVLEHLPFLFWLVEAHRPRLHVSLGVKQGVGYLGICQAVDRLEPGARNFGIDSWPEAARETWRKISRINEDYYSDNSKLIECAPAEFEPEFQKGSIDLLLLDHEITPKLSERIVEDWLPRLSRRGIIAIHGIMHAGFGKSAGGALLAKLREGRPTIRFETGDGIEVILHGEEQNEYLRNLASLSVEDASYNLVHAIFARLGAANRFEWMSRNNPVTVKAAEARANTALKELADISGKLADLERDYADRSRRAAEFQGKCFDLERVVKAAEAERDEMHGQSEALKRRQAELEKTLDEAIAARDEVRESAQVQGERVAELERVLNEAATARDGWQLRQERISALETELSAAASRAAATKSFLASIEEELAQFASIAQTQSQDIRHLKTKLREADIRLATREMELSLANARSDQLRTRLEAFSSDETSKSVAQWREKQLAARLEKERTFIRTCEPRLAELLTERLRLNESNRTQSRTLSEMEMRNNALEQKLKTRAAGDVEIMRRLDLRGTAMTSLGEENVRLQAENAQLLQKYEDLVRSTARGQTSPARKAIDWLRNSKN